MYKLSTSIARINYHICHSVIKQAPGVHSRREGVGCWWLDGWAGRRCPHPRIRQSCDCHQKALPSCCHPGLASAPSVLWRSWEGAPAAMMRSPGSRKPWNAGCQLSRLDQHSYNTKQRHINKTLNSQLPGKPTGGKYTLYVLVSKNLDIWLTWLAWLHLLTGIVTRSDCWLW